jgi:hypothetical protein
MIGVRTTKLQGDSDHIKIISNRDIKNVLNKSREISAYNLEVKVSLDNYRLKDVEEILERELPKLQGKIPGLINGPSYLGVSKIQRKSVTLCFEADFEEEDYDEVILAVNHALMDIFDEYGIRRRKTN